MSGDPENDRGDEGDTGAPISRVLRAGAGQYVITGFDSKGRLKVWTVDPDLVERALTDMRERAMI